MRKEQIVAIAREQIGVRWQHQARVGGIAMDCAGLPILIGQRLGISIESLANYGRLPVPSEMRRELDAHLVRAAKAEMQPGDVVWIRFEVEPQHFAVVGDYVHGGLSLIHAYNGAGVNKVVEHRLDEQWLARIVGVWRFPGVQ
jgi:cell wall-associated NlpC family hydrolase